MDAAYNADSIAMFKRVLSGQTYRQIGWAYGLGQTAVQHRIRAVALDLQAVVGVLDVVDTAIPTAQLLRSHQDAYLEALEHYTPERDFRSRLKRAPVPDQQVALLAQTIRSTSHDAQRDVALLMILFSTAAKPLEIARLEVGDYLHADGTVRESSTVRAQVAINEKARPLYFRSATVNHTIDEYLAERIVKRYGVSSDSSYRGLVPSSKLILRSNGDSLRIREKVTSAGRQYHCSDMLTICRRIFSLAPSVGMTALSARRTVAHKLAVRGISNDGIGQLLGVSERAAIRRLLAGGLGSSSLGAATSNLLTIEQRN